MKVLNFSFLGLPVWQLPPCMYAKCCFLSVWLLVTNSFSDVTSKSIFIIYYYTMYVFMMISFIAQSHRCKNTFKIRSISNCIKCVCTLKMPLFCLICTAKFSIINSIIGTQVDSIEFQMKHWNQSHIYYITSKSCILYNKLWNCNCGIKPP